jgi:integrase
LFAACGPYVRAIVEAAIETGCRIGELLSLQWHQVRWNHGDLFLPAKKTKTKRDRWVPMSTRLRAILELRRLDPAGHQLPPHAYVFGNALGYGQRVVTVDTAYKAACDRAGIVNLHIHDLRREAGSRWMDAGVPLATIQKWLGHANISQTSTYLATTSAGEHEAMRRFEAVQAAQRQRPVASPGIGGPETVLNEALAESDPDPTRRIQ